MTKSLFQTLLIETVNVTRDNFQPFFMVSALVSVVTAMLMIVLGYGNLVTGTFTPADIENGPGGALGGLVILTLSNLVPYAFAFGVISVGTVRYMQGNPATLGECIAATVPRLGMLVLGGVVAWSLIGLGFMALVIPGVYLLVVWYVLWPVMMTENLGVTQALARSNALSKGARFAILGIALFLILTNMFAGVLLGTIMPMDGLASGVVAAIIRGFFIAVSGVSAAVTYQVLLNKNQSITTNS